MGFFIHTGIICCNPNYIYKADRGAHFYWLQKGTVEVRPDHILNLIHYEVKTLSLHFLIYLCVMVTSCYAWTLNWLFVLIFVGFNRMQLPYQLRFWRKSFVVKFSWVVITILYPGRHYYYYKMTNLSTDKTKGMNNLCSFILVCLLAGRK